MSKGKSSYYEFLASVLAGTALSRGPGSRRGARHNRRRLIHDLDRAVERGDFELHLQPYIALNTEKPRGVEALIRWNNATFGQLNASEFIPLAQEIGAIASIGSWVADEAARVAKRLEERGYDLTVAFNVCGLQLHDPAFLSDVDNAIARAGVSPSRLTVEVTESIAIADLEVAKRTLDELRTRGVEIALDDFGTGFSSLRHLLDFRASIVKIDRSFISSLLENPRSAMITGALIDLAHSLGALVQAEGVEDASQMRWLSERKCDLAQGYHISRPLPPQALFAWLDARVARGSESSSDTAMPEASPRDWANCS